MGQRNYDIDDLARWVNDIRAERRTNGLPYELALHLQCACRHKTNMEGLKFWIDVAERLQPAKSGPEHHADQSHSSN